MTDPRCQKRPLVKRPPFYFLICWSFVWFWLWKAATLSPQDLAVMTGRGHTGPIKAEEHTWGWRTLGLLPQLLSYRGTDFNPAIDLAVIVNRANSSWAEFDSCTSEGLSGCFLQKPALCAQWISSHALLFLAQAGFIHNQVLMSREPLLEMSTFKCSHFYRRGSILVGWGHVLYYINWYRWIKSLRCPVPSSRL